MCKSGDYRYSFRSVLVRPNLATDVNRRSDPLALDQPEPHRDAHRGFNQSNASHAETWGNFLGEITNCDANIDPSTLIRREALPPPYFSVPVYRFPVFACLHSSRSFREFFSVPNARRYCPRSHHHQNEVLCPPQHWPRRSCHRAGQHWPGL